MIAENGNFPGDPRVSIEARTLRDWGYAVTVIGPDDKNADSQRAIESITVYRFLYIRSFGGILGYLLEYTSAAIAIFTLTAYVCIAHGFDIVHVANPPDFLVPLISIYKLFGKRIIFDQHDLTPELYAARFSHTNALLLRIQTLLERLSYRLADHSIVTNESYRSIALVRGRRVPSDVTIVRNGPDLDRLATQAADEELRKRAPHIIVFAGIVGYQDGLDYLCRALHHLHSTLGRKDFLCVVLGDGDALRDIRALAHQLDLDSSIWFAGWISNRDLYWRYLASADICVSPEPSNSYNDRSTFVKIMEYMAVGKPIVAFDLPESRFSAGQAALFAAPNNEQEFAAKLKQLMDSPDLRLSRANLLAAELKVIWPGNIRFRSCCQSTAGLARRRWKQGVPIALSEHRSRVVEDSVSIVPVHAGAIRNNDVKNCKQTCLIHSQRSYWSRQPGGFRLPDSRWPLLQPVFEWRLYARRAIRSPKRARSAKHFDIARCRRSARSNMRSTRPTLT